MSKPSSRYFTVEGRLIEIVNDNDVRAIDPATGATVSDGKYAERIASGGLGVVPLSKGEYMRRLGALRQSILEGYVSAPLAWERTGDGEVPYRAVVDGHVLGIRVGEFPLEALYTLQIDGQEVYEIDDWPAAWKRPALPSS